MPLKRTRHTEQSNAAWDEYCGFLSLSLDEYMNVQKRLLTEQIGLYCGCELGNRFFNGAKPGNIAEFCGTVPLTSYDDYADILLQHVESALPAKPAAWIEVPWKGSTKPKKSVPFTQSMLEKCFGSFMASLLFSMDGAAAPSRGLPESLLSLAAPPYLNSLLPYILGDGTGLRYRAPVDGVARMSRLERIEAGIKMGVQKENGVVMGGSGVLAGMSGLFWDIRRTEGSLSGFIRSLNFNYRFLKAVKRRRERGAEIRPADVWRPSGLICTGSERQKRKIEDAWGICPSEIFGAAESGLIGMETPDRDGMVLLPDVCFYEFIPSGELEKNTADPAHTPKTYLANELVAGETYELVITSFKGGAFVRCRLGELLKCLTDGDGATRFPRFSYVDKTSDVIDIAGLTAFTERTVLEAIRLSKLDIEEWFAVKEYDRKKNPYMHLYVEIGPQTVVGGAVTTEIMHEHLNIYFGYLDSDYPYVKRLTGTEPLRITILPTGTIRAHTKETGHALRHMNPSRHEVVDILRGAYGEIREAL